MSSAMAPAATAFDRIAPAYDDIFTRSLIGQAQRRRVWAKLLVAFPPGSRILELNCGTGEDARFLAERGRLVVACDASPAMLEMARSHDCTSGTESTPEFLQLANEDLDQLPMAKPFDGAFSNFSGLNCVADLRSFAEKLARLVKPGRRALICVWSRICVAEVLWYLAHGQPKKALRRISGKSTAQLGNKAFPVFYPTVFTLRRTFSPWFQLRSRSGVGVFVPPSYMEPWARKHPRILQLLDQLDCLTAGLPVARGLGDHVLLEFIRCKP